MSVTPMATGNECVLALNSMGKAHLYEKIERPIDCRGFSRPVISQLFQHIVRLDRSVCFKQKSEHLLP